MINDTSDSDCTCCGATSGSTPPERPFNTALPRFLTEFCFGDFYTRDGLTLDQRELLVLCALATIGETAAQLGPNGRACLQTGNTKTEVAAVVHCFPYIGFPRGRRNPRGQRPMDTNRCAGASVVS